MYKRQLLAHNIVSLLTLMAADDAAFAPDFNDEIVSGSCVTHAGDVRHAPTREMLGAEPLQGASS